MTADQLDRMARAWQRERSARYAAFRASLTDDQRALWQAYVVAGRELQRVQTWRRRQRSPRPRPHNLRAPTWPDEANQA